MAMNNPSPCQFCPECPPSQKSFSTVSLLDEKRTLTQTATPPCDYLTLSLISSICFCPPLGLVALFFSLKARQCASRGDITMADKYSFLAYIANSVVLVAEFLFWTLLFLLLFHQETRTSLFELNIANLTQAFNATK